MMANTKFLADLRRPAPENLSLKNDGLRVAQHTADNIARINESFARMTEVELQHGVPTLIPNPFVPSRQPLAFLNGFAETEDGTRYDIATMRFGTPRTDGFVEVTAYYDLRHTELYYERSHSVPQSIPNNTETTVLFDTVQDTRGTGISYSAGTFTVAEAGTYLVSAKGYWEGGIGSYTGNELRVRVGGTSGPPIIDHFIGAALTAGAVQTGASPVKLTAGGTILVRAYQTNSVPGPRNLVGNTTINRATSIRITRLYNDTTPTCFVSGLLVAGA